MTGIVMAEFGVYQCACGILLEGSVAVKHIYRCKERLTSSPLAKACASYKDKSTLLYELLAEVQTCCDLRISTKDIEEILSLVQPQQVVQPEKAQTQAVEDPEYIECVVCREPSMLIVLKFECGHAYCQTHFKSLYGKSAPKCPSCFSPLSPSDIESIAMLCESSLEEAKSGEERKAEEETCKCSSCNRPSEMSELVFLDCMHSVCASHIQTSFKTDYPRTNSVNCPVRGCPYTLMHEELQLIVGKEAMDKMEEERTMAVLSLSGSQVVNCCKCSWRGSLEKGSVELNYRDATGANISIEAAVHMAEFRLRCPSCHETSCVSCRVSPYHEGFTCEQLRLKQQSKHCRFCEEVVSLADEVCQGQDCQDRLASACTRRLECGHRCAGVQGEEVCLPCLEEGCAGEGVSGHDLCVICYCESLSAAPCVRLLCGHTLHYHCLNKCLEKRWNGPRITFKFAKCPSCNEWAVPPHVPELLAKVEKYKTLHREITEKAVKRLQFEGEDKLPRLSDPDDDYFQQPEKYAMDRFCYYECFKCKQPYFGGKKDCQQRDQEKEYDPTELVCAKCAASVVEGAAECPTHGSEYIQFKCRFCCAFAVWFCWGTTHFCEPCHQLQVNGGNPAGKAKELLPRCPGVETCPLKVEHPPNGDEFGMGCAMCRDLRANLSDF